MGLIHISFKLHVETGQGRLHGCLLVPLPDAISLACYVLEIPDGAIESRRRLDELDESMKDAMLEIGNFVGGSVEAALRSLGMSGIKVHSEGCQGVRANVRPALVYEEGTPLVVGRATIQLDGLPESEAILILPDLSGLEQPDE